MDVSKLARKVAGAMSLSFAGVRSAGFVGAGLAVAGLAVAGLAVAGFCVVGVAAGFAGAGLVCAGAAVAGLAGVCADVVTAAAASRALNVSVAIERRTVICLLTFVLVGLYLRRVGMHPRSAIRPAQALVRFVVADDNAFRVIPGQRAAELL